MKRRSVELAAIGVICLASSVLAQQPRVQPLTEHYQRGSMTPQHVIQFLDLFGQLGAAEANKAFGDQLIWWWAAEKNLDENAATKQLTTAYRQRHGNVPAAFLKRLSNALAGLPAPGTGVYFPPPYVVSGPLTQRPPQFVLGRPRLGPNEKQGISQISAGIEIPRRGRGRGRGAKP